MHHNFNYERALEFREKYIPLPDVLEVANPLPEDILVDIGAGDGFYSIIFAERVKKVYYVDPSETARELLKKNIGKTPVNNLTVVSDDVCENLDIAGYNKVFFSNSFHDIICREDLIDRLKKNSSENLEIILTEFKLESEIGPPVEIRIDQEHLDRIFSSKGFRLMKRIELRYHYISRFGLKS